MPKRSSAGDQYILRIDGQISPRARIQKSLQIEGSSRACTHQRGALRGLTRGSDPTSTLGDSVKLRATTSIREVAVSHSLR